jgi:hypothetical protein
MDFFEAQDAARGGTWLLVASSPPAVLAIIAWSTWWSTASGPGGGVDRPDPLIQVALGSAS